MSSLELRTGECDGRVVVVLRGELDVIDAASVAAALTEVAARERHIIVDLAGLEFIDSSGLAALACARKCARRSGGDLLLAAPQQSVLRVLSLTRLIEVFSVHTCVEEAAARAGHSGLAPAPVAYHPVVLSRLDPPGRVVAAVGGDLIKSANLVDETRCR
jgi:anti-sigma B factor antagonist